jgi:hypothetical protein
MFLQAPAAAAAAVVLLCTCHRLRMNHHLATTAAAVAAAIVVVLQVVGSWQCRRTWAVVSCKLLLLLRVASCKVSCKQAAERLAALLCLHL